jgi:hypothetical protein
LRVSCACGINLSHSCNGKFLSTVANPAMKWFLNVWIARSAALTRWFSGSTSCSVASCSFRNCLIVLEHSLSLTWNCGLNPFDITEIFKYFPWAREGGCYDYTIPKDPKSHSPVHNQGYADNTVCVSSFKLASLLYYPHIN